MVKPIPANAPDGLMIDELTPMRRPALSRRGPPELPRLMAASIWITPLIERLDCSEVSRPKALTIPVVNV